MSGYLAMRWLIRAMTLLLSARDPSAVMRWIENYCALGAGRGVLIIRPVQPAGVIEATCLAYHPMVVWAARCPANTIARWDRTIRAGGMDGAAAPSVAAGMPAHCLSGPG